jgi:dipeptide/tripeptide permease
VAIYSAPLLVYGTAVSELRRERNDTFTRLFYLLYLMVVGFGILFSNAAAVIGALIGRRSPFDRTPKFGLVDKELDT